MATNESPIVVHVGEEGTLQGLMRGIDDAWPVGMPPELIRVRFYDTKDVNRSYKVINVTLQATPDGGEEIVIEGEEL